MYSLDNRRLHAAVAGASSSGPVGVRYKLYKVYPRSESLLGKRVFEQYKKVSEARRESRLAEEVEKFSSVLFTAPRRSAVARPFLLVSQISGRCEESKVERAQSLTELGRRRLAGVVRDREFHAVSSAAAVRRDQDPHSLHGAKC